MMGICLLASDTTERFTMPSESEHINLFICLFGECFAELLFSGYKKPA